VKRFIRRRCGFGCVVCGHAVFQYEHVDPPFSDAKIHDPSRITLLCGTCHDRVTRGLLSKSSVKANDQSPKCKSAGYSWGAFDVGTALPKMQLGTIYSEDVPVALRMFGETVFGAEPPEEPGGPFRL